MPMVDYDCDAVSDPFELIHDAPPVEACKSEEGQAASVCKAEEFNPPQIPLARAEMLEWATKLGISRRLLERNMGVFRAKKARK